MHTFQTRSGVLLSAILLAMHDPSAQAVPICRWVNERGQTEIAAVVPDKFKKAATCVDSAQYELSAEQRRLAEQRLVDHKAEAKKGGTRPQADKAASAAHAASAASRPGAKRPAEVVTATTDCLSWWRIYDESVECFGPYRTTRGATKVEAFDKCNVVPSPESRCGPRSR